jgi:hypothetical protein
LFVKPAHRCDASRSTDPDGDSLSYPWFHYPEAGRFELESEINGVENAHFILKLTDKGSPPMTRCQRVMVSVVPR